MNCLGKSGLLAWFAFAGVAGGLAQGQTAVEHVVHTFGQFPNGANPFSTLARDSNGNLYGTANVGGAMDLGTVFELGKTGYKVLHSFAGGTDGANPFAGVTLDSAGNVYGTTFKGGIANAGVVYKVSASGQESVLYAFTGEADGSGPYGGVILDAKGDLYGTTYSGGTANAGVVYKLSPEGQLSVLYSFTGDQDGSNPYAGLVSDSAGNLYGTTVYGGLQDGQFGCGVVFELSGNGTEKTLYTFQGGYTGGCYPYGGVIRDASGNFYGATTLGNGGMIYKLDSAGDLAVLYQSNGTGLTKPQSSLALDAQGNLYGTASAGGPSGGGGVFEITASGSYEVVYEFPGAIGNIQVSGPPGGVILDGAGDLVGASANGGTQAGNFSE